MRSERLWHLRDALADGLAGASSCRIDRALGADLAEGLDDVLGVARSAAARVQRAAPGVLQGAASGYLAGGPAGAVVGGTLGALGVPPYPPVTDAAGRSQGVANPAALELLLTVLRPEIVEALVALALGRLGAPAVPVAGVPVPVAAVPNLVQSLAEQAAVAHPPIAARRVPAYLGEAYTRGEDIGSPMVQAESLRALLRESADWLEDHEIPQRNHEVDGSADLLDLMDIERNGGF